MYPGLLPDRVFGFGVEAGAGFGGEFAVAVDGGLRVERAQTRKQFRKGAALGRGAGVGGMAGRVEAADIADADGAAVVADTVGAGHVERAPRLYGSVKGDDEVIADVGEAPLEMPGPNLESGKGPALALRSATDRGRCFS